MTILLLVLIVTGGVLKKDERDRQERAEKAIKDSIELSNEPMPSWEEMNSPLEHRDDPQPGLMDSQDFKNLDSIIQKHRKP